ncbi:hypothetical protein HDU96_005683 [Phlyctochytrium bullatum]|nr:hypothetical protein HDU96_005683 [Phlyctochytrium bullatum]
MDPSSSSMLEDSPVPMLEDALPETDSMEDSAPSLQQILRQQPSSPAENNDLPATTLISPPSSSSSSSLAASTSLAATTTRSATVAVTTGTPLPLPSNDVTGVWVEGKSTHYGPFPSRPFMSEVGYLPNDIGVGCSTGVPGGDPRWLSILSHGLYPPLPSNLTQNTRTVYPRIPTVAVSQRMYGGANKEAVCFKRIRIRNKAKPAFEVEAYIVDFCPTNGCLWKEEELARNADIYGEETWKRLGGGLDDGVIAVEIQWPVGVVPKDTKSSAVAGRVVSPLTLTLLYALLLTHTVPKAMPANAPAAHYGIIRIPLLDHAPAPLAAGPFAAAAPVAAGPVAQQQPWYVQIQSFRPTTTTTVSYPATTDVVPKPTDAPTTTADISTVCGERNYAYLDEFNKCNAVLTNPQCRPTGSLQDLANVAGTMFSRCICDTSVFKRPTTTNIPDTACWRGGCDAPGNRFCNSTLLSLVSSSCTTRALEGVTQAFGYYLLINGTRYYPSPSDAVADQIPGFCRGAVTTGKPVAVTTTGVATTTTSGAARATGPFELTAVGWAIIR